MTPGDGYRTKAAEFNAKARDEKNPKIRAQLEHLGRAYLRLAEQALRNASNDIVYGSILPESPGRGSGGPDEG
jgi:hypothetical protein